MHLLVENLQGIKCEILLGYHMQKESCSPEGESLISFFVILSKLFVPKRCSQSKILSCFVLDLSLSPQLARIGQTPVTYLHNFLNMIASSRLEAIFALRKWSAMGQVHSGFEKRLEIYLTWPMFSTVSHLILVKTELDICSMRWSYAVIYLPIQVNLVIS